MKLSKLVLIALFPLLLATAAPSHAYSNGPRFSVDVSVFYDGLSAYGSWYSSPRLGLVWSPRGVPVSWQPYSEGRWVYTEYGWTWVSDYDWGWAPFHYGRWDFDPVIGWVWVPGTEWAPAWVDFYQSDDWIGWSPLPPGASFRSRVRYRDPDRYVFVPERDFLSSRVGRWNAPRSRHRDLFRRARNVTRYEPARGTYVNRSVAVDRIERATRHRVAPYRVVESRSGSRSRGVRGREVEMYRPRIRSTRPSHRPAVVRSVRRGEHNAPGVTRSRGRAPARTRARTPARPPRHRTHARPPRVTRTRSAAPTVRRSRPTARRAAPSRSGARRARSHGRAPARHARPQRRAHGGRHHGKPPA